MHTNRILRWMPACAGGDGASLMSDQEQVNDPPLFTKQVVNRMKLLKIPISAAEVIKGIQSVGGKISRDRASDHLTGYRFNGSPNWNIRRWYAAWLKFPPGTDLTKPVDDQMEEFTTDLVDSTFEAATLNKDDAHQDLAFLLTTENSGLAKYVLRKLRQLTPASPPE